MRDTKSILLLLLSTGMVGTWVYHLYDKTQYSSSRNEIYVKDSMAVAQAVEDSLKKIYSSTITSLDARLDSTKANEEKLQGQLENKLSEINRLRTEIAAIIKKNDVKKEDLDLARNKSIQLQQLVAELENKNLTIEEEKKQIAAVLDKVSIQVKDLEGNVEQLNQENKVLAEKVNLASTLVASNIKLTPVAVKNNKEQETQQSKKASKFVLSFDVKNNVADYDNTDILVVINQPDGKIIRNDDLWEAPVTLQNGRRLNYTRRVRFDYQKGESKQILFSLNADEYMKGTYSLQLYHNGYLIGHSSKTLN